MSGLQDAGVEIEYLFGDGDVYHDETYLVAVRYEISIQTDLVFDGEREIPTSRTISGTITIDDPWTRLPADTDLVLLLEGGDAKTFRTSGTAPEYTIAPVGSVK